MSRCADGAVKTAEATTGGLSLQSLLRMSRATPSARGIKAIPVEAIPVETRGLP
jgi:hypothetical protein